MTPAVCVIDDDAAVRTSLSALLGAAGYSAHAFPDAEAFLAAQPCSTAEAACVLSDVRMPGMDGLALLDRLAQTPDAPPVIVMTGHGDIAMAVRALKAGAVDFLEKPFSDHDLMAAIAAAMARPRRPAPPEDARFRAASERISRLTPREREVLAALALGKPNKLIAHELGLSERTIEIHRARMMERLEAGSFAEALRLSVFAELARP